MRPAARRDQRLGVRIVCVTPHPSTTQGEARAFAELARRERWHLVVLATSTHHVPRARLAMGRCFTGAIFTVRAPGSHPDGGDLVHEWAGLLASRTIRRGC